MGDLSTITVRLGHILQGSKAMTAFLNALDAVVDECFKFRLVSELPDEAKEWREDAAWILQPSVDAGLLTPEDADAILCHDNCDWRDVDWTHHCLGPFRCKAKCRSEQDSKEHAKQLTRTNFSGGCPIALLYRWKLMNEALAFNLKARGEHELGPRALQRMWSTKALAEAVVAAEMARNVDELSFATKAAAKAASCMRFFEADTGAMMLIRGFVISSPLQIYLSRTQRADKLVQRLTAAVISDPESPTTQAAFTECVRINFSFVSGAYGKDVVESYTKMLSDFRSDEWRTRRMPEDALLASAWVALVPMARAWARLVHYFEDPRFLLFGAVTPDRGHSFTFNAAHAKRTFDNLHARAEAGCPCCVDRAFGKEVMRLHARDPQRAHSDLSGALAHMRIGSAVVERQHLIGQEMRAAQSRGVGAAAQTVAQRSYIGSVVCEARRFSDRVHRTVLQAFDMSRKQFSALSKRFRLDGARSSSKSVVKVGTRQEMAEKLQQKKGRDAFRAFRSAKMTTHARVGTQGFADEERRLAELWANAAEEERAVYEGHHECVQKGSEKNGWGKPCPNASVPCRGLVVV